ncbi:hypothetical protein ACM39_09765 [Chryseobacterium sp. FH2]|uniref:hypothetical protein n=1 Tax=Chryseobacterium sp. FH2 TaxID=1674291 RepID=UPI00065AF1F2|nr:hypothetical protein [Chryseobacterium sp. FH2]KMQ68130.1 hypothetical protein ACM39_09765 [Chryseobacterium sp. FH2]
MLIGIIYKIVLLIPLIKSFFLGRKYSFSAQNYLFVYLLITVVNEWISFIRNKFDPNVKVGLQYNFYFIFCVVFFYFFYSKVFKNLLNKISLLSALLSLGYIVLSTNFLSDDFDKRIGITITLFYIINSMLWFYHKIIAFDEYKITDDPVFWISTALLMWSCFFIFRVTPMFFFDATDKGFLQFLRTSQNVVNIFMYIMFYISLMKYEKKLQ